MKADFRSDTVTRPTPEMRAAMAAAEVGDDVFGDDPTTARLEQRVADILGKEAALFVPSGTMGNQLAVHLWARPGEEILLGEDSHIFHYEMAGPALLSGVQCRPVASRRGVMDPEAIAAAIRPDSPYLPKSSLLCLENSHNLAGGRVVPLEWLEASVSVARRHGLFVHLDGARLWNASAASGVPAAQYAALADSVMVSLSKGLGAPIGSMLSGGELFVARARRARKAFGGGMRQVGVLAAAGLVGLDSMGRLAEDHVLARRIAERLSKLPELRCDPAQVETNIVLVDLAEDAPPALWWQERLLEQRVLVLSMGPRQLRLVTHRDVGTPEGEALVRAFEAASEQRAHKTAEHTRSFP
jgi:threonine aldolase